MRITLFFVFFLYFQLTSNAQSKSLGEIPLGTEKRIALLVGNKEYRKYSPLSNTLHDVDSMARTLDYLGFEVVKAYDLEYGSFISTINSFTEKAANYDVALFYYSGHGIQFNGDNFLVPIDAKMKKSDEAESQCINMNRLYLGLASAGVKNSLVFLDACRDNPFIKADSRNLSGGLSIPRNPPGSFVAYATKAGNTASDNPNENNGLFTRELIKHMRIPNLGIREIMDRTLQGVESASDGTQIPGRYDELRGDFVFIQDKRVSRPSSSQPRTVSNQERKTGQVSSTIYSIVENQVEIPAGDFEMGLNSVAPAERPAHDVRLNSFFISPYEITVGVWKEYCRQGGKEMPPIQPDWGWQNDHPIVGITWYDAVEFCNWLSKINGLNDAYIVRGLDVEWNRTANGFRLPTEAEWEFAARAGNSKDRFVFPGSNDQSNVAWWYENSREQTHPIGQKRPNVKGIHDMSGNVWEWCWDWYDETYYSNSPKVNPIGPLSGRSRVLRGGSWLTNDNRTTLRQGYTPQTKTIDLGFRVVRNL